MKRAVLEITKKSYKYENRYQTMKLIEQAKTFIYIQKTHRLKHKKNNYVAAIINNFTGKHVLIPN